MGIFENWPYTNYHDLNLNWIIGKIKDVDASRDRAIEAEENAAESATAAHDSEVNAKASEDAAALSASNAHDSEVNAKASEDAAKDYADNIADPVAGIVSDWLSTHIATPSTPPIDDSLTIMGAAADAKAAGDLIRDLQNQVSTVVTKTVNIYDQDNYTATTGQYLNYMTGNVGSNPDYVYVNEYIPVDPSTEYFGSVWDKLTMDYSGPYNQFILFYEEDLTFISGISAVNPFTTPANCKYIRVSFTDNIWTNKYLMFEKGSSHTAFRFYGYIPRKPFTIVDKNGFGDFTTIADAMDAANENDTIFISPGVYEETLSCWYTVGGSTFGKRLHLIGMDPENTIIKNTSRNYSTPPLEFSNGSIRNLTIYAEGTDVQTEPNSCYAMHMETHSLYNSDAYFENCIFKSNVNYPIGIGLRGGSVVTFKNCDFIGNGSDAGCIWFHDADAAAYRGTSSIIFDGCNMICDGNNYPIRINAMHNDNTTYITFKRNVVWAKTNETSNIYNTWNTGGVPGTGWRGLLEMYLTYDSVLNSESGMNYR